ncbi:MAG: iron ABC transporter permease [Myxococcota bacterium]|nr:iron ABC transporter permease [Myxococcota bacterium]
MIAASLPFLLLVLGCAAALLVGATGLGWPADPFIAWHLRLPRLLLALSAGGGLAACGLLLQVLLRNPLASPYTLGVGSGAALGAAAVMILAPQLFIPGVLAGAMTLIAIVFLARLTWAIDRRAAIALLVTGLAAATHLVFDGPQAALGAGAWVGALAATGLVLTLRRRAGLSAESLVLSGIAIALCASAGVLLLHYLADRATSTAMLRWTMGGLASVGLRHGLLALAPSAIGLAWLVWLLPQLNLMQLGDDWAQTRGVEIEALKRSILVAVALWTGCIVALCGPISFVGLIAPHMARRLVGDDLRRTAPAAILLGAGLLALCDAAARIVMAPAELPVGILTALLGGPAFLALLLWRRG